MCVGTIPLFGIVPTHIHRQIGAHGGELMTVYHSYVMSDYTQLNISDNVFYSFLIILELVICTMFGDIIINTFFENKMMRVNSKPIIAYKKAILNINSIDAKNKKININFKGVGGNNFYEIKDRSKSKARGFHMYKDIQDAFDHVQSGDAVLEVMGYGKIQYYEKGYITTKQKVLQVIIDENNYGDNINLFQTLITNDWTDDNGNKIIIIPKKPYTYKEHFKTITIPPINQTVLPYEDTNNIKFSK